MTWLHRWITICTCNVPFIRKILKILSVALKNMWSLCTERKIDSASQHLPLQYIRGDPYSLKRGFLWVFMKTFLLSFSTTLNPVRQVIYILHSQRRQEGCPNKKVLRFNKNKHVTRRGKVLFMLLEFSGVHEGRDSSTGGNLCSISAKVHGITGGVCAEIRYHVNKNNIYAQPSCSRTKLCSYQGKHAKQWH